jgi:hypothetical protein
LALNFFKKYKNNVCDHRLVLFVNKKLSCYETLWTEAEVVGNADSRLNCAGEAVTKIQFFFNFKFF